MTASSTSHANEHYYYIELTIREGETPYRVQVTGYSVDDALARALKVVHKVDYVLAEIHQHREDGTTAIYTKDKRLINSLESSSIATNNELNYKTFTVKLRRQAA